MHQRRTIPINASLYSFTWQRVCDYRNRDIFSFLLVVALLTQLLLFIHTYLINIFHAIVSKGCHWDNFCLTIYFDLTVGGFTFVWLGIKHVVSVDQVRDIGCDISSDRSSNCLFLVTRSLNLLPLIIIHVRNCLVFWVINLKHLDVTFSIVS